MFGHFNPGCSRWAAGGHGGRGRHGRRWHGFGRGSRHGMDGDDIRAGRMLAQGDIRLIMLALIAEQPRHGYELIKLVEEITQGWYSPSPGIVYPTLTYLEEAGYVSAQAEGAKKLYTITEEGRAHLKENKSFVDVVLERLAAVGARYGRMRQLADESDEERGAKSPPLVRAAIEQLRALSAERIGHDAETETKVVEILARAAAELRRV
jgi:DNA-binding PadR family transcriptional regulator